MLLGFGFSFPGRFTGGFAGGRLESWVARDTCHLPVDWRCFSNGSVGSSAVKTTASQTREPRGSLCESRIAGKCIQRRRAHHRSSVTRPEAVSEARRSSVDIADVSQITYELSGDVILSGSSAGEVRFRRWWRHEWVQSWPEDALLRWLFPKKAITRHIASDTLLQWMSLHWSPIQHRRRRRRRQWRHLRRMRKYSCVHKQLVVHWAQTLCVMK